MVVTIILAGVFTYLQGLEYRDAGFTMADGVYGSTFYAATGTHGFHVIIGTLFLGVGALRAFRGRLTMTHHKGLENAIVYWHFVDVVWLFLFAAVYFWGANVGQGIEISFRLTVVRYVYFSCEWKRS